MAVSRLTRLPAAADSDIIRSGAKGFVNPRRRCGDGDGPEKPAFKNTGHTVRERCVGFQSSGPRSSSPVFGEDFAEFREMERFR